MNDTDIEQTDFQRRARAAFTASVEALDAQTRSQLNRARQTALAELERRERAPWRTWLPAGALAATAAIALVVWQRPGDVAAPDDIAATEAITELPASDEDLALVSEDPEFYAWSAQQTSMMTNGTG